MSIESPSLSQPAQSSAPSAAQVQVEDLDYEGRVRARKHKDELSMEYQDYLQAHPELTPMLHDILHHLLIVQPDEPLQEIRAYVQSRTTS